MRDSRISEGFSCAVGARAHDAQDDCETFRVSVNLWSMLRRDCVCGIEVSFELITTDECTNICNISFHEREPLSILRWELRCESGSELLADRIEKCSECEVLIQADDEKYSTSSAAFAI